MSERAHQKAIFCPRCGAPTPPGADPEACTHCRVIIRISVVEKMSGNYWVKDNGLDYDDRNHGKDLVSAMEDYHDRLRHYRAARPDDWWRIRCQ